MSYFKQMKHRNVAGGEVISKCFHAGELTCYKIAVESSNGTQQVIHTVDVRVGENGKLVDDKLGLNYEVIQEFSVSKEYQVSGLPWSLVISNAVIERVIKWQQSK